MNSIEHVQPEQVGNEGQRQTFRRTPLGIRKGVVLFRILLIPADGREDGVRELCTGECFTVSSHQLPSFSQANQAGGWHCLYMHMQGGPEWTRGRSWARACYL